MPVSEQEVDVFVPLSISMAKRLSSIKALIGLTSKPFPSPLLAVDCEEGEYQPLDSVVSVGDGVGVIVAVLVTVGVLVTVELMVGVGV